MTRPVKRAHKHTKCPNCYARILLTPRYKHCPSPSCVWMKCKSCSAIIAYHSNARMRHFTAPTGPNSYQTGRHTLTFPNERIVVKIGADA